jgi:hypothetical protein
MALGDPGPEVAMSLLRFAAFGNLLYAAGFPGLIGHDITGGRSIVAQTLPFVRRDLVLWQLSLWLIQWRLVPKCANQNLLNGLNTAY